MRSHLWPMQPVCAVAADQGLRAPPPWVPAATGPGPAAPSGVPADDPAGLWSRRFEKPSGGELAMADLRGKPLVLNFWATWCPPCVKEMPELDRFHRTYAGKGWQVVGLAIDGPTPVREFLVRVPVGFAIGLAGFEGTDLGRQLGTPMAGRRPAAAAPGIHRGLVLRQTTPRQQPLRRLQPVWGKVQPCFRLQQS